MAEGQKRQSVGGKFGLLSFQAVLFGADRVRERPPRYSNQIAVRLGVGRLDLAIYKAGIDQYSALIIDAADGSKKAKSAMDKQRGVVIKMYTQLGHYVEAACNDDLATFNTSGFTQQVKTKTAAGPLTGTRFNSIDRGPNSGDAVVKPEHQAGVRAFDVRYALEGSGGALSPWTVVTLTSSKKSTIHGLTPAGTYQFQIRALGKLGYTDWLDTKTFVAF